MCNIIQPLPNLSGSEQAWPTWSDFVWLTPHSWHVQTITGSNRVSTSPRTHITISTVYIPPPSETGSSLRHAYILCSLNLNLIAMFYSLLKCRFCTHLIWIRTQANICYFSFLLRFRFALWHTQPLRWKSYRITTLR